MNSRLRRPAVALISTALTASVLGIAPAAHAADGNVFGKVTSPNGQPIEAAEVDVYQYDAAEEYWQYLTFAETAADGTYSLSVPEGQYRVGFYDYTGAHVNEYYENAASIEDADTITVPVEGVEVNAALEDAAHVTGVLSGPGDTPAESVYVVAWREVVVNPGTEDEYTDYWYGGSDFTALNGSYDVGGLPGGTYHLQFGASYMDSIYATEYYNDKVSLETADDLVVAPQATVDNIDADLALDAEVSGLVTDETGAPLEDASIEVLVKVGTEWDYVGYDYTGPDGTYEVTGLAAGTYRVRFNADLADGYSVEWWNNVGRRENATNLTLVADEPVAGINAQMVFGEHDDETVPAVTNTALPTISGAAVVGQALTATNGSWTPTPTEYYYDWLRDGEFIMGSYDSTYVPTAADVGKKITVLVSAGAPDLEYGYAESVATAPVAAAPVPPAPVTPTPTPSPTPTPTPIVDVPAGLAAILANLDTSGKPKVGKTVKVTQIDLVLRTAVTYKFKWFAGTKRIKGATKYKLKVTRAMKGKKLSVKVTATAASTSKSIRLKVGRVR